MYAGQPNIRGKRPYAAVAACPSQTQWKSLLTERWNLKAPTLIISVIGSRAELSKKFKRTLKNGLWKAAESAGCWIVSDSMDRGLTKVAGEAVRDYREAYGGDRMVLVGVTSYEKLMFRNLFKTDSREGKDGHYVVQYPEKLSEDERDEGVVSADSSLNLPYWSKDPDEIHGTQDDKLGPNSKRRMKHHFRLNENHQFVVMMDRQEDKDSSNRKHLLDLRIMLERILVTWAKPSENPAASSTSIKTPQTEEINRKSDKNPQPRNRPQEKRSGLNVPQLHLPSHPRASIVLPYLTGTLLDQPTPRLSDSVKPDQTTSSTGSTSSRRSSKPGFIDKTAQPEGDGEVVSSDTVARVPICGIVAGGGESTLQQVYASVTLNRCPMVIVKGTGGTADVIANVIDFINFKNSLEENVITEDDINLKISSIIHETRSSSGAEQIKMARKKKFAKPNEKTEAEKKESEGKQVNYRAYAQQVTLLRELIEQYPHLLSVFDSEDTDLDGYMISALLSSAGMDTPRDDLNLDQLEIAIRLNRADIARTKIFLEGKRWKKGALDDFMFTVILNDQNDFVGLLLENGFNLEHFLSVHTLERLYTESLKKTDYKTELFQLMWKRARIYKMEWVMLRDVGRIIRTIMGDFYQPLYLTRRFRNTVIQGGAFDSSEEDEEVGSNQGKHGKKDSNKPGESSLSSNATSASTLPEEEAGDELHLTLKKSRLSKSVTGDTRANDLSQVHGKTKEKLNSGTQIGKDSSKTKTAQKARNRERSHSKEDSRPLLERISLRGDSEDEATLKGQSDQSIGGSTETLVTDRLRTSSNHRHSSSHYSKQTEGLPPISNNGRRCIVRPITAFQLGYQPYVGYGDATQTNGLLIFGENVPTQQGTHRTLPLGKHRVIDGSSQVRLSNSQPPRAIAESVSNLKLIRKLSKSEQTDKQSLSTTERRESSYILQKPSEKGHPPVVVVKVHSASTEARSKSHERRRSHAQFADPSPRRRSNSASPFTFTPRGVKGEPRARNVPNQRKSIISGSRVAHSLLHPLTDPEIVQLQLREAERVAREQRREKERRRRHRVAQGKFTLLERLTGKAKEHRLEELKPSKLANFAHSATVYLERPAREIMVMCILLGKLTMARLFWTYEKEPIAAALTASILFGELANKCDDVTCKEEYEEAARTFEEKADEVLEECYQEDRVRTQLLLSRKLDFYGGTSVIRLAARGRCIRFMAHPCCQELLSGVWMGELSPKFTFIQFLSGIIVGLTFPLLLPQITKYIADGNDIASSADQGGEEEVTSSSEAARKSDRLQSLRYSVSGTLLEQPPSKLRTQFIRIQQFYQAPITRFIYSTLFYLLFLAIFSLSLLKSLTLSFSYYDYFLVLMVVSFLSEELKQAFGPGSSISEYISDGWNQLDCIAICLFMIGFGLRLQAYRLIQDEGQDLMVSQPLASATNTTGPLGSLIFNQSLQTSLIKPSFDSLIDRPSTNSTITNFVPDWLNDSVSQNQTWSEDILYTVTSATNETTSPSWSDQFENWTVDMPYYVLTNDLFTIARIFYALSLFAFFVRLMYIFSFSMVLGPKLIMINRMIVHDLLPFLCILLVCQMGYGIAFQSISFANGCYAEYRQDEMTINSTIQYKTGLRSFYDMIIASYFQMLGEFRLEELQGESSTCRDLNKCPQTSARRLTVVMLSAYVLLTQVLMFNLLVATFTSTYNEIEGSSQYFWCYQRYEMIQEFVDRPSVAPPFMLLWYTVEFSGFILQKIYGLMTGQISDGNDGDDPFSRSLQYNPGLDRKLTKWEHMIGSRITRADAEGAGAHKWTGGGRGDAHAIILRSGAGAGAAAGAKGLGVAATVGRGDPSSMLQGIGPIFGPETEFIEHRFQEFGNQLSRFSGMEERLAKMVQAANSLVRTMKQVTQQQAQMILTLNPTDGRRLVGLGRKRGGSTSTNLILEAVTKAVAGLGSHCSDIEERIEEKIRIEEQCVKAVLTRTNAEDLEPDVVLEAKQQGPPSRGPRGAPTTGKILERLIISHRLWRIVPFNFETYPGIRMNVPPDKLNWKVPYPEYRTFRITEDRLSIPYVGMDDGADVSPQNLPYNDYDSPHGVSRKATRGRVRVFRKSNSAETSQLVGLPLNPSGRSGLQGKGLLPHWGPNHAVTVALTRAHPDGIVWNDLPVIQVAVLCRNQNFCLPWYLIDHRADCEFHECTPNVIRALFTRRVYNLIPDRDEAKAILTSLKAANISLVSTGFLHDHLNADHAWIETVFLNIQENPQNAFRPELLQVFLENDTSEQVIWLDVCHQIGMRSSHDELLRRLALHCKAYFNEELGQEEYG
ncbi:hypothetical protein CRM22_009848 [Opisthorchis felineus]|uniref:TRPM SLOG domain-containing protein n=1 Tax=Opisthorchis felineus TaxID=147828 RepID=A0A4S2LB80_OPIFE|nr:hypothetical protein CRM22_009848 [Opisthorchis felineus]